MKLQSLIVIFIIIILPIIILTSIYISNGLRTIQYQSIYDEGLLTATQDAVFAFEQNTANNAYSANPEPKRDILKASIKTFEKSLANTCEISSYNLEGIEEYIPAIVFGMYDGFYMYAPSNNPQTGKYEHSLKNYVYYSEPLSLDNVEATIRYSLDNYVVVSGDLGDENGYIVKSGYLIVEDAWEEYIDTSDNEANSYYMQAKNFTQWFNENIGSKVDYLNIKTDNNPEDENSKFVQHKRAIIKETLEGVLNSTITAYSKETVGYNYKMPKFSENEWNRIYTNISIITFFQGKSIGYTKYNGYCILNSTNSNEYVNPNLMYFTDEQGTNGWYHDIRCTSDEFNNNVSSLKGYRIGSYRSKKVVQTDEKGNIIYDGNGKAQYEYIYDHNELACYSCINGPLSTSETVYEYINKLNDSIGSEINIKKIYYTSLARERYNTTKLQ